MKIEEAHQLIKEAEAYIGMSKAIVTQSQLGLPSTIRECKFDGIELREERGGFSPMARLISIDTEAMVLYEDLETTLNYLKRQAN